MTVGITTLSTLRSLADLIEAIDQDWPVDFSESAVNKAVAEAKLLKVVCATIRHDLEAIEAAHRKIVHDALLEVAMELAFEDSLRASADQRLRMTDSIMMRALMKPVEAAIVIDAVAKACKVDAPAVVQKSVRLLRSED